MKKLKHLTLIVFILCFYSFSSAQVKLEYVFRTGDTYEWTQTAKQIIKQNIMGTDQIVENNINSTLILKVVSINSTGASLACEYTNLSMSMKMPGGAPPQSLESSGDTSKLENKVMRALLNKPFTIAITKMGVIEKIEGEENLWSGFASLGLSEQQKSTMKATLEQMLNEGSLKSSFAMLFVTYPDKKIKIGDSWKTRNDLGSTLPLTVDNTWVLTDATKIAGDGVFTTTQKEKIVSLPNGIKAKFDLSGTQKTLTTYDPKTGWASEIVVNSTINGKMFLLAGGMIPQDMEVPMEILSESKSIVIKK